jgi:hypothetical protein
LLGRFGVFITCLRAVLVESERLRCSAILEPINEVLPPVEAEQFELGMRHAITPGLTFIGALFDVAKPTNEHSR